MKKGPKQILVLGGGGFLGSHIAETAHRAGYTVRIFDQCLSLFYCPSPGIEVVLGDWRDREGLMSSLVGIDVVLHMVSNSVPASKLSIGDEVMTNLIPALSLMEACRACRVERVVFASSGGAVYGSAGGSPIPETQPPAPCSSYGLGKTLVECCYEFLSVQYEIDVAVIRAANAYGERQSPIGKQGIVPIVMQRIRRGDPIQLWGNTIRDYIYVGDVAQAFVMAAERVSGYRVYNVGTGRGTALSELVALIEEISGYTATVVYGDLRDCDVVENVLAIGRAKAELDWQPHVDLRSGLQKTWDWLTAKVSA